VRAAYPRLSHRYYKMKAKLVRQGRCNAWDRNAPLPFADERDRLGRRQGHGARGLWRLLARDGEDREPFFDRGWIDAPVRPGKAPGAFAHPTVPSAHPYVMLNYQGKPRDVMTLAHELGHGVHQVLAAPQGALMAPTPLTLAETASRVRRDADLPLDAGQDHRPQAALQRMLAGKVEDMLNTVVRQIAFYTFERAVHTARKQWRADDANDSARSG
jgi:oligoendopeptidase F